MNTNKIEVGRVRRRFIIHRLNNIRSRNAQRYSINRRNILWNLYLKRTPLAQIKENKMNSAVIGGVVVVMIVIIIAIASKQNKKGDN